MNWQATGIFSSVEGRPKLKIRALNANRQDKITINVKYFRVVYSFNKKDNIRPCKSLKSKPQVVPQGPSEKEGIN